jgi:hypothetical protein
MLENEEMSFENQEIEKYVANLYMYMKEKLGFKVDADVILLDDIENSQKALGKTAYYVPRQDEKDMDRVCVYTTDRHMKDVLRSVAHELIHHHQNCNNKLPDNMSTENGYAQHNGALRELEKEAYEQGNILFRDWEDGYKQGLATADEEKLPMSEKKFKRMMNRLLEGSMFYSNSEQTDYFHLNKSYNRYVQEFLSAQRMQQDEPMDENDVSVGAFNGTLQSVLNPRLKTFGFALAEYDPGKMYKYVDYQANAIFFDVLADAKRQYPLTVYYLREGKVIEKRENIDFQTAVDRLQQLFNLKDGIVPKVRATGYTNL